MTVTAGLGGMGGAQPLAVTMNEGVALCSEVNISKIKKRIDTSYCDMLYINIDEAIDRALVAKEKGEALSIGVCCNAVDLLNRLIERNCTPDILTTRH